MNNPCDNFYLIIGIVGAGIGGTSAAYFLRELFGDDVEIDIFEKQHVGGRLAPVTISGHNYNAGGTIIHPANVYMVNFTDILGKTFSLITWFTKLPTNFFSKSEKK